MAPLQRCILPDWSPQATRRGEKPDVPFPAPWPWVVNPACASAPNHRPLGARPPLGDDGGMIIVNTETIPGYRILEFKGLVQGNTIRTKHLGRDIAASLKNLVGGELRGYTELLTEARRQSLERMMAQAQQLGANAVINVRFTTSAITQGAAELYAYGTAVVVRPGNGGAVSAVSAVAVGGRPPAGP